MAVSTSFGRAPYYVLKRSRARQLVCHIAPFLVSGMIGYVGIQLSDRAEPGPVISQKIIPQELRPGQFGVVHYDVQVTRSCPGTVHRYITDEHGVVYDFKDVPTVDTDATPGTVLHITREIPMPFGASAGTARYHATVTHWCNIFQKYIWPISTTLKPIEFQIIRDGDAPATPPSVTVVPSKPAARR